MYANGQGVTQDDERALTWYQKAAEQGHTLSQVELGAANLSGRGVSRDYKAATYWYRQAADAGNLEAQFNLGIVYYGGLGVPQDYVEAHKWWNLAASDYQPGKERDLTASFRDDVAKRMTPDQIAEAQRLAREWKIKKRPRVGCQP